MKTETLPRLAYSMDEVSEMTTLSRRSLERLIKKGTLKTRKIGRRNLIPTEELRKLLGKNEAA